MPAEDEFHGSKQNRPQQRMAAELVAIGAFEAQMSAQNLLYHLVVGKQVRGLKIGEEVGEL